MFQYQVDEEVALRLLETRHAADLLGLVDANREYLRQWMPWLDTAISVEAMVQFISHSQQQWALNASVVCGIWWRGRFAGVISFNSFDWSSRIGYLGYWLGSEFQGHGIMTRACRALVVYGFEEIDLNRVDIRCAVENHKSRAIPRRLGFAEEGTLRDAEWLYDHFVDHVVYGMTANVWRAARF